MQSEQALEKLYEINHRGSLVKNNGITVFGRGVDMNDKSKDISICMADNERNGHVGIMGSTRVGKSGLLINVASQDIKKGYNVVIIDPKGDKDLLSHTMQVAAEAGRLHDVMMLTPIYPDHSIKIDPLSHYYMQEELVEHVVSGIKAKEDFFIAIAGEITQAVIAGLALQAKAANKPMNINFDDIAARISYFDLQQFQKELMGLITTLPEAADVCANIEKILHSPQEYFGKVTSSLRTTTSALVTGNTGKIIGKSHANEFVKRFEEGKGIILYCNTGSMLARRTAHIIARVLISMIQSMVGRFLSSGRVLSPPLCLHIDEGHDALYLGIDKLFTKAGGANCWIQFYTQSMAFVINEIGPEAARGIIDCMNTLGFLRLNHPETAKFVEDSSPDIKKFQTIITPDDLTGRVTLREVDEKLILGANVLQLEDRQFYMRSRGKFFKAFTIDLPYRYVNVEFPEISGSDPYQQHGITEVAAGNNAAQNRDE